LFQSKMKENFYLFDFDLLFVGWKPEIPE